MADNLPIVVQLQSEALDPKNSLAGLLRKAKVIAVKLALSDAIVWIDRELDGYEQLLAKDLPPYRKLKGEPEAFNPYHGWRPIHFQSAKQADMFSDTPIGQSIGSLEEMLKERKDGYFIFQLPAAIKAHLMNALEFPTDVRVKIGYGSVFNITEAVRNLVLNWSLELEKAGILGEGLTFSMSEKREAGPVTQQFIAQNIGHIGNVSDQAKVKNLQVAFEVEVDPEQVRDVVRQVRAALPMLPDDQRGEVAPLLDTIDAELALEAPQRGKLVETLKSIRTISEGAAGNLAASGIVGIITAILG